MLDTGVLFIRGVTMPSLFAKCGWTQMISGHREVQWHQVLQTNGASMDELLLVV